MIQYRIKIFDFNKVFPVKFKLTKRFKFSSTKLYPFHILFYLCLNYQAFSQPMTTFNSLESGGEWSQNSSWEGNSPGYNNGNNRIINIVTNSTITSLQNIVFNNNSTLNVNGNLNIENVNLTTNNNAQVKVNGSMTVNNIIISQGSVAVEASGNLKVNNNLSFTSTTTASTLTTNGTLEIGGNLSASNNLNLTVNDFLSVGGNLTTAGSLNLNISTNGVMEIYGDMNIGSLSSLTINGLLIVFGKFNMAGGIINVGPTGVLIIVDEFNSNFMTLNSSGRIVFFEEYVFTSPSISNSGIFYSDDLLPDFSFLGNQTIPLVEVYSETLPAPLEATVDILFRYGLLNNIPLPIDLLSFTATATEHEVLLKWSTATETNNDFFTLEKTRDGKEFELVAKIDGAGNSKDVLEYTYTDTRPFAGTSYYRLTQTDFDGTSETFPLISVVFKSDLFSKLNIASVYPNAFQEAFVLQYTSPENNPVELNMINLKGEVIYRQNFSSQKGFNELRFTEGSLLQNDVYMIYLVQGGQVTQTQRVLKR